MTEPTTPARRGGDDREMSTRGLCELTLESCDHRALARFYHDALRLPLLAEDDDRVWLACGPRSRLGLWSIGEKEFGDRGGRHVHFALSVPRGRLHDIGRQLAETGVPTRGPVQHDGGDQSLYFEDPDGTSSSSGTSSRTATAPTLAWPR